MSDPSDRAYQDGASGFTFTGSTANEYTAYMAGQATRQRSGGPPPPPDALLGFLVILALPIVFTVMGALYPVAGLAMLASLVVLLDLMLDQGIGGIVIYVMSMVWLSVALMLGCMLERKLEGWRWFRRVRHIARIVTIGFIVHVLAFGFFQAFDPSTSFFERLTVLHVIIVALGCVGAHFLSKKFDAGLRNRVTDRIPGMSWALYRFNPRRKANLAAMAALDERIRRGDY